MQRKTNEMINMWILGLLALMRTTVAANVDHEFKSGRKFEVQVENGDFLRLSFPDKEFQDATVQGGSISVPTPTPVRRKFKLILATFGRRDAIVTVNSHHEITMDGKVCVEEYQNWNRTNYCTNVSATQDLIINFGGKFESEFMDIKEILNWENGRALTSTSITNPGSVNGTAKAAAFETVTNWVAKWHCVGDQCAKNEIPVCGSDEDGEDSAVVRWCCQCYPGEAKLNCSAHGGLSLAEAKAAVEEGFVAEKLADCVNVTDSSFGHCPYFCQCGDEKVMEVCPVPPDDVGSRLVSGTPTTAAIVLAAVLFQLLH